MDTAIGLRLEQLMTHS